MDESESESDIISTMSPGKCMYVSVPSGSYYEAVK